MLGSTQSHWRSENHSSGMVSWNALEIQQWELSPHFWDHYRWRGLDLPVWSRKKSIVISLGVPWWRLTCQSEKSTRFPKIARKVTKSWTEGHENASAHTAHLTMDFLRGLLCSCWPILLTVQTWQPVTSFCSLRWRPNCMGSGFQHLKTLQHTKGSSLCWMTVTGTSTSSRSGGCDVA